MSNWLTATNLTSDLVTLRPLMIEDEVALIEAAEDGKLWELWFTGVPNKTNTKAYIEKALKQYSDGVALPFVVIDNASQKVVGCTRICNAVEPHKRVEIGYTWYAKSAQRTSINTQTKLLLLTHIFEQLGCIAVEFRTNWHNHKSRTAIARLGAKQDGVLRNHQIMPDGTFRDTVVFSILQHEWPTVKVSLSHKLNYRS